jgi:hypothetical protein
MELHPHLKEQALAMPDIHFKAMDYLVDQLHSKFDCFIPAFAAMSKMDNNLATASNHIMEYLAGKPHSTKQAHTACTQPPLGCSLNAAGKVVCSYCKRFAPSAAAWQLAKPSLWGRPCASVSNITKQIITLVAGRCYIASCMLQFWARSILPQLVTSSSSLWPLLHGKISGS